MWDQTLEPLVGLLKTDLSVTSTSYSQGSFSGWIRCKLRKSDYFGFRWRQYSSVGIERGYRLNHVSCSTTCWFVCVCVCVLRIVSLQSVSLVICFRVSDIPSSITTYKPIKKLGSEMKKLLIIKFVRNKRFHLLKLHLSSFRGLLINLIRKSPNSSLPPGKYDPCGSFRMRYFIIYYGLLIRRSEI